MNCIDCQEALFEQLESSGTMPQDLLMQEHLDSCQNCQQLFADMSAGFDLLNSADDQVEIPAGLTDRTMARILLDVADSELVSADPALTQRVMSSLGHKLNNVKQIPFVWQLMRATIAACVLGSVIFAWGLNPYLLAVQNQSAVDSCAANLKSMGRIVLNYKKLFPNEANPLLKENGVHDVFLRSHDGPFGALIQARQLCACPSSDLSISYQSRRISQLELDSVMPGVIPVMWDVVANHEGGHNVLFLDGNVGFVSSKRLEKLLFALDRNSEVDSLQQDTQD